MHDQKLILDKVLPLLEDADLLLYRSQGLIAREGRGVYNHAAKVVKWKDTWFVVDTQAFVGVDIRPLEQEIVRWPGMIDLYKTNPDGRWPEYNRRASIYYMMGLAHRTYGYWNLFVAILMRIPLVRLFFSPNLDDSYMNKHPPFCSQFVVNAERIAGGVDPVPRLADTLTEPNDLSRSPFYQYIGNLIP